MIKKFIKYLYLKFSKKKRIDKSVLRFMQNNPSYKKYLVGKGTYGFPKIYDWNDDNNLKIGNYCSIGDSVSILLGGEHYSNYVTTYPFYSFENSSSLKDRKSKGSVIIGNDVWIGNNVTILSGVKIGNGAIIGAGSIVTKNIEDYAIVGGNPAKLIRKRFTDEQVLKLNLISWWNWNENKINQNINDIVSVDIEQFINKNYEL